MTNKPKIIEVLINTLNGQVGGSRFLKEVGLLKRNPDPNDWDILLPDEYLSLAKKILIYNGLKQDFKNVGKARYGGDVIEYYNTFRKEGIVIDLFSTRGQLTIATALLHKSSLAEKDNKHQLDLIECFESLCDK